MPVKISDITNPRIAEILKLQIPKQKKKRRASRRLEDSLQKICVKWFDLQYPHMSQLLFAIPNGGGYNHKISKKGVRFSPEGNRMKAMGVRKGVLDVHFMEPRGGFFGLWLELKVDKNVMDTDQIEFTRLARARNHKVVEIRTLEQFIYEITSYLKLPLTIKGAT